LGCSRGCFSCNFDLIVDRKLLVDFFFSQDVQCRIISFRLDIIIDLLAFQEP
jgi:hypothetical protein